MAGRNTETSSEIGEAGLFTVKNKTGLSKNEFNELTKRSRRAFELVGRHILRLREAKGISQRELAATAGVSQAHISGLENGNGNPTWETISRVCHALDQSFAEVMVESFVSGKTANPSRRKTIASLVSVIEDVLDSKSVEEVHSK